MIYLELFLTFLERGAVSFGGGYGMISIIREQMFAHGWLTESELLNFIAVAESTPGSLAVNMATFIGASQGGLLGAFLATLSVALPAFIIILVIAAVISDLLKYAGVNAFLGGIRPAVVGMIIATAVTMFLKTLLSVGNIGDAVSVDLRGLVILAILAVIHIVWRKLRKKRPSPILMILISAGLGLAFYS